MAFEAKQLASMAAEISCGCPKQDSQFKDLPGFSELWDSIVTKRAEIRKKYPNARFDIPNEFPDPM